MTVSNSRYQYAMKASVDLSANMYCIVKQDGAGTISVASLATDSAICGILQNDPSTNGHATVADSGRSKVLAGAAITAGDHFSCNGSGRAITVTSGDMACGRALDTVAADLDVFDAVIYTPVRWAGAP